MAISALWANKNAFITDYAWNYNWCRCRYSNGFYWYGGYEKQVEDSIASLGSNMLIVNASATKNAAGVRQAAGSNVRLKLDDAEAIKRK